MVSKIDIYVFSLPCLLKIIMSTFHPVEKMATPSFSYGFTRKTT
jgi:hypothetical protein